MTKQITPKIKSIFIQEIPYILVSNASNLLFKVQEKQKKITKNGPE